MLELNKLSERTKNWFSSDLKMKLIVILGLCGMMLIFISQFLGNKSPPSNGTDAPDAEFTAAEYVAGLENRLTDILSSMEGVGNATVMITLENAGETVYAQEEKRNIDKQQEPGAAETVGKTYQKENTEQKYIIIDGRNGQREALVKTRLEPRIQGVVVVCAGAGSARVDQSIIHVVTTALNIPTTRVCVVKISK